MSAICNQCIGTSDYRRGPRANVCLIVSPLFCLHGEFGSPCLGILAFDPVYVCTHYNNSPREGSPVAVLTSEGVRVPRLLQLRLQTFAHQRQEGARTPWLPALGQHLIIHPDNGWVVMVMVCRGKVQSVIAQLHRHRHCSGTGKNGILYRATKSTFRH